MAQMQEKQKQRKKRQKERKRKKRRKNFLLFSAIIIIVAASFLITVKICNPDFDFSSLIPKENIEQAVKYVEEDILGKTTQTTASTTTTTTTTTQVQNYDYDDFSEFDFDDSLKGNRIGALLNNAQGSVTYSSSYIYFSIDGKGVYKFEPTPEVTSKVNVKNYKFRYLNVLDDYIYMVDIGNNKLMKSQIVGGDMVVVAGDISFAYLYDKKIYYIGTDNTVGYINTQDLSKTVLYTAPDDKTLKFVGISLSRVFFTQYDEFSNYYEYITIAVDDKTDKRYFMDDTDSDNVINMQLESGYFYYYEKQDDSTYDLIRKKFGSDKTVTLLENCTSTDYPVISSNRLYYTEYKDSKVKAKELNMNSGDTKTMFSVSNCDDSNTLGIGYGYYYVFLFGEKSQEAQRLYKGSSIYTSSASNNVITFKNGEFTY